MNLIEQLGGYEEAKELLRISMIKGDYDGGVLKKTLLEYRRQHNIYDEGDLCKLSTKHDYGLYKFLRMRDGRIYLEDRLGFAEFGIAASAVSHATDKEIKAGKRLEVNE